MEYETISGDISQAIRYKLPKVPVEGFSFSPKKNLTESIEQIL